MLDHPNPPIGQPPLDAEPLAGLLAGLLATHWKLALCGACGHERMPAAGAVSARPRACA